MIFRNLLEFYILFLFLSLISVSQPTQPSVDTRSITNDTFEEISAFDQELSDFLVVNRDLSTVVERLGDREEKAKIKKVLVTIYNRF